MYSTDVVSVDVLLLFILEDNIISKVDSGYKIHVREKGS